MINYQYDYAIVGGDLRQAYLSEILRNKGYRVLTCGVNRKPDRDNSPEKEEIAKIVEQAKHIIGPIPLMNKENNISHKFEMDDLSVSDLISLLKQGQQLFAGCIPASILDLAREKGIACFDFMKMDSIAVLNSIATAEGIIAEAIIKYPSNLHDSHALVLGYGRCGKTLADKLRYLTKTTTVSLRNSAQEAVANAYGLETVMLKDLDQIIHRYDIIFNSIPYLVLDYPLLQHIKKGAMILDIASNPGGVNFEAAKQLGINAALYPSLPGKYSPKSSAEILADYIIKNSNG